MKFPISDPVLLAICLFIAVVLSIILGLFAIPIILIMLVATGIHWYNSKPASTVELRRAADVVPQPVFPASEAFLSAHLTRLVEACGEALPAEDLYHRIAVASQQLYEAEDLINPLPPPPPARTVDEGRYRDRLLSRMRKLAEPDKTLDAFNGALTGFYLDFIRSLPGIARVNRDDRSEIALATVPLLDVIADVPQTVQNIYFAFHAPELIERGLFSGLRKQLQRNLADATGDKPKIIMPADSKLPPRELVGAYLKDTPFELLFDAHVPFAVSLDRQLEHTMIVGGTRWGKSQLIGAIIQQHLSRPDPPGIIVIDSQGDFLEKLSHLEIFDPNGGRLADRILLLNPEDSPAPSLNMFDTTALRAKGYTTEMREQIEAEITHLFNYVFASVAQELTTRQGTAFSFLAKLLLSMPNASITTLRELLEDKSETYEQSPYRHFIEKLDPTSVEYFKNQYYSRSVKGTRHQVAARLYTILQVPAFERMFSGANKVDFFQAMNEGRCIVVNTSKATLQPAASALFGRYVISRVLSGAFERVVIPMAARKPCLLFIDEAQEYFDESLDTLLTQVAKFKLGLCIAFQYVDQLEQKLRASVIGNTTIKYVGGVTYSDARFLAREMRVTEQMILSQKKDTRVPTRPEWAQFATFVRNDLEHALSLVVPFYALENQPKMTDEAYRLLLRKNEERVSSGPERKKVAASLAAAEPVIDTSPDIRERRW